MSGLKRGSLTVAAAKVQVGRPAEDASALEYRTRMYCFPKSHALG